MLAACFAYLLTSCAQCQIRAGEVGAAPAAVFNSLPKTVILNDGGVLVGEVTRDGERYVIVRAGSEIQLAATNVLCVCDSLEDAYELRRTKIERPDAASHLLLADWCLRYNLVAQAARELKDAREFEPLHPRLALLERRLAAASAPRSQSVRPVNRPAANAATDMSTGEPPEAAPPIDELPDGAVERFTRRVQPILVNNCTTSGCHQPGGPQNFQLDRSLLHSMGNRRTTMQNLAAALALVDRRQPHLSPLLTVPRETHGGMQRPIFGTRQQSAFKHLVDWVAIVSNAHASEKEANRLDPANQVAPYDEARMAYAAVSEQSNSETEAPSLEAEDSEIPSTPVRYGAQLEVWQPKDPFDPEIFNRAEGLRLGTEKPLPHQVTSPKLGD
jgi:hypothetical protein